MWAAEKCDLFYRKQSTEVINSLRKDPSGNWAVVESNIIHEDGQTLAEDKTGPLAISKAIIAIHGQQLVSADN